jgi:hypothetical protein
MDKDELVKRLLCEVEKLPGIGISKAPTDSLRMVLCDAIDALTTPQPGVREEMLRAAEICDSVAWTNKNTAMLGPELNATKCAQALRAEAEKLPQSHKWDASGERCLVCGDKDWMNTRCSRTKTPEVDAQEERK